MFMPKLGEILLADRLLTMRELDSALENHILHGVKLGTCLVEMGYVGDEELARAIGKQTGHPYFSRDELLAAGERHLSLIPPAAIKKHRLIPVGMQGAALRIATDNELSPKKHKELEQLLGRPLEPVAVSGYAVDCFLEKMFGVPRPGRFLPKFSRERNAGAASAADASPTPAASPVVINGVEWKELGAVPVDDDSDRLYEEFLSTVTGQRDSLRTLSEAAEQLSRAVNRDDVARTILDFMANSTAMAALVTVRDGTVRGWKGLGQVKIEGLEAFAAPMGSLPDLQQAVMTKKPFFGQLVTSETQLLWHLLHHPGGLTGYFPVFVQQRVVAVLLCSITEKVNPMEVIALCRKASYALEILILRSKLLSA